MYLVQVVKRHPQSHKRQSISFVTMDPEFEQPALSAATKRRGSYEHKRSSGSRACSVCHDRGVRCDPYLWGGTFCTSCYLDGRDCDIVRSRAKSPKTRKLPAQKPGEFQPNPGRRTTWAKDTGLSFDDVLKLCPCSFTI